MSDWFWLANAVFDQSELSIRESLVTVESLNGAFLNTEEMSDSVK